MESYQGHTDSTGRLLYMSSTYRCTETKVKNIMIAQCKNSLNPTYKVIIDCIKYLSLLTNQSKHIIAV